MTCTRINKALSDAFTAHSHWCRTGKSLASSKALMTAITGKDQRKIVPLEEQIEALLCRMASRELILADCIRMEHGAGWQSVARRRSPRTRNFLWLESTTYQKANLLGLTTRHYLAYLARARNEILGGLTQ
ncbi:hypothetical protein [Aeromonas phage 59.1]|nr:hypothetical protein [Aeromonas phage 59.1]